MREKETGRSISRNLSARKFAVFACYLLLWFLQFSWDGTNVLQFKKKSMKEIPQQNV